MHIFKDTNFNFLRWRWHAIAFSSALIIAGLVTIWTKGIAKGVEFAGGTVVIEQFEQAVTDQQVRAALESDLRPGPDHQRVRRSVAAADDDSRAAGWG